MTQIEREPITVPAPEPCGWHPTGAWRFLRLTHEAKRPDPIRVGARVRVVATGKAGLVVVDFGNGYFSIKLDDGRGSDIVARDGLTMSKDES